MSQSKPEIERSSYPVQVQMPVAWGQMDAFGHVNNTQFFRFFEDARLAYFERVEMAALMEAEHIGPILGQADCVFRRPLSYPDQVTCCARVSEIGVDRFTMQHAVFSEKVGLAGHGDGRVVMIDYRSGAKVPIPDALRAAIEALG